jgi:hypothetical protein
LPVPRLEIQPFVCPASRQTLNIFLLEVYISDVKLLDCVRFEVFTSVTMKNGLFWMLRRVALVRTGDSEELSASIIRVTIGELGRTLAVTRNRRLTFLVHRFLSP